MSTDYAINENDDTKTTKALIVYLQKRSWLNQLIVSHVYLQDRLGCISCTTAGSRKISSSLQPPFVPARSRLGCKKKRMTNVHRMM